MKLEISRIESRVYALSLLFIFGTVLIFGISVVSAADFTPQGNINLRDVYNITGAPFVNATLYYGNGSQLVGIVASNANFSTFANSSEYWDDMDTINTTQMEDNSGTLNILISWFTSTWNTIFGTKTTDDLSEGSTNLYDNQSWNETRGDNIHINIDGDTMTGNLSLGNNNIVDTARILFNLTACGDGEVAGTLCHDVEHDTLKYYTVGGQTIQISQEVTSPMKNKESFMVMDGSYVYQSGASGDNLEFKLARADNFSTSGLVGVLTRPCNAEEICAVTFFGFVNDIDTSSFSLNDKRYLSSTEAGNATTTSPGFPNNILLMDDVVRVNANTGRVFVFPRLDTANGMTFNTIGVIGDIVQTDYKIRSLPGNDAIGQNVFCIEMNGSSGNTSCHLTLQPGGPGQASSWERSGIVVPEDGNCNNENRTDPTCFANSAGYVWKINDFNTSVSDGADWGITGELEVIKSAYIQGNITTSNLNSTSSITLQDEQISFWANITQFVVNMLLTDGSRSLTANWDQGAFNLTNINSWFLGKVNWSSIQNKFSGSTTDDLTEGSTNLYDNQSWNETYADTLYYDLGNSFSYYNSSDFLINDYYLKANPFTFWNDTYATFNETYADTLYLTGQLSLFFFNNSDSFNSSYTVMNTTINPDLQVDTFSGLGDGDNLLAKRILSTLDLSILETGAYNQHTTIDYTSGSKDVQLRSTLHVLLVNGTEIQIGASPVSPVLATGTYQQVIWTGVIDTEYTLSTGDYLTMYLYAFVSGGGAAPTVDLVVGGSTSARLDIGINPNDVSTVEVDPFWTSNSSTVARIGDCPSGQFVQNTTTGGVECGAPAGSGTVQSVAAGDGMDFSNITSDGFVTMGLPGSLTAATSNALTATSHTHAVSGFLESLLDDTTPQLGGYLDANGEDIGSTTDEIENIYVGDTTRIYFGDGQDASMFFNGTNLIISG